MLTVKQRRTLDYIKGYAADHGGLIPSFDEIAAALATSKGGAHRLLTQLEERGRIRRMKRRARAIEVIPERSPRNARIVPGKPVLPVLHPGPAAEFYVWDSRWEKLVQFVPKERKP